jgi:hypothetical protein
MAAAGGKMGENHGTSPLQTYPRHICPIQEINLRRSVIFHEQLLMYWVARQSLSLSTAGRNVVCGGVSSETLTWILNPRGKVSWSHFGQSAQNMSLTMSSIIVKFDMCTWSGPSQCIFLGWFPTLGLSSKTATTSTTPTRHEMIIIAIRNFGDEEQTKCSCSLTIIDSCMSHLRFCNIFVCVFNMNRTLLRLIWHISTTTTAGLTSGFPRCRSAE